MDMETEYKHNLLTVILLHWNTRTFSFMPAKELREAVRTPVRPSAHPSCFVSGAYLLYSLRQESQIWCVDASWDGGVSRTIFGSL